MPTILVSGEKQGGSVKRTMFVLALAGIGALLPATAVHATALDHAKYEVDSVTSMSAQEAFAEQGYRLLQEFPDSIVDFVWLGSTGSVVVTPAGFDEVSNALQDDETSVIMSDFGAVPYLRRSDFELRALEQFDGIESRGIGVRYDPFTHQLIATVFSEETSEARQRVETLRHAGRLRDVDGVGIAIEYSSETLPQESSTTQGGESYGGCTGGFIGNRSGSYGIITAGHCTSKPSKYDGDTTGSTYKASGNYDLRFTALTGGTPENKTRIGSSTLRVINSIGIVSAGMNIANYGKITGFKSTKVTKYEGCLTYQSGNVWCGLYSTPKVNEKGDSGGPWLYTNRAYGIQSGMTSTKSFFTPIAMIGYISGTVTVKTAP